MKWGDNMEHKTFAVLGGDTRFATLASLLAAEGCTVYAAGFDLRANIISGCAVTTAATAASLADIVILPMPATRDFETLNAPLSSLQMRLDEHLLNCLRGRMIFTGLSRAMRAVAGGYAELEYFDYCEREDFQLRNAQATAEGAVAVIVENFSRTICGSSALITGYGRIGKALAPLLRAFGAQVSVCARRDTDIALIECAGMRYLPYSHLPSEIGQFDLIVNTAPAMLLDEENIVRMNDCALIVDLASSPGGVDFAAAHKHAIKAVHALALPGKYSPITAARNIKTTIFSMLREE